MARTMVAEKTDEHDQHFVDGLEYVGFRNANELVAAVHELLHDDDGRRAISIAGWERCLSSGYATEHRAQQMLNVIQQELSR